MDIKLLKVAPEGLTTIFLMGAFGWILALVGLGHFSFLVFLLTLFTVYFFRDPDRFTVEDENVFISPADGKVVDISMQTEKDHTGEQMQRISVFLSIFDCHINRFPVSGKVLATKYSRGKFVMAFKKNASDLNERLSTLIQPDSGPEIVMVQIAGLVARRIVSDAKLDSYFNQGEKFGMIKFGSRVDLYIPGGCRVNVTEGQKVIAGETVLAWAE